MDARCYKRSTQAATGHTLLCLTCTRFSLLSCVACLSCLFVCSDNIGIVISESALNEKRWRMYANRQPESEPLRRSVAPRADLKRAVCFWVQHADVALAGDVSYCTWPD